jgi:hypothetical protein
MEFASEKELMAQTGHQAYEWPRVIVKELVDNGIDACEDAEIAPIINVTITSGESGKPDRIIVEDNGPGIPPDTIAGIIDYNVRISSREAYISPTRGRQGNALKTISPMSYVRRAASSIASSSASTRSSRSRSSRIYAAIRASRPAPALRYSGQIPPPRSSTSIRSMICLPNTSGSTRISRCNSSSTARS